MKKIFLVSGVMVVSLHRMAFGVVAPCVPSDDAIVPYRIIEQDSKKQNEPSDTYQYNKQFEAQKKFLAQKWSYKNTKRVDISGAPDWYYLGGIRLFTYNAKEKFSYIYVTNADTVLEVKIPTDDLVGKDRNSKIDGHTRRAIQTYESGTTIQLMRAERTKKQEAINKQIIEDDRRRPELQLTDRIKAHEKEFGYEISSETVSNQLQQSIPGLVGWRFINSGTSDDGRTFVYVKDSETGVLLKVFTNASDIESAQTLDRRMKLAVDAYEQRRKDPQLNPPSPATIKKSWWDRILGR